MDNTLLISEIAERVGRVWGPLDQIGGCAATEDRLGPGSTQGNASLDGNVVFILSNAKLYLGEFTCNFLRTLPELFPSISYIILTNTLIQ